MTNHDEKFFDERFDIADEVEERYCPACCQQCCDDAKAALENVAADATQVVKDNLQEAVDTKCNYNSGADQEWIQDTKKRQN